MKLLLLSLPISLSLLFLIFPPPTLTSTHILYRRTNSPNCYPQFTPSISSSSSSPPTLSSPNFRTDCAVLRQSLSTTSPTTAMSLFTWVYPFSATYSHNTCILHTGFGPESPLFETFSASTIQQILRAVDAIISQCVNTSGVGGYTGIGDTLVSLRDRMAGGGMADSEVGWSEYGDSGPGEGAQFEEEEGVGEDRSLGILRAPPPPSNSSSALALDPIHNPDTSTSSPSELLSHPITTGISSYPISFPNSTDDSPDTSSPFPSTLPSALIPNTPSSLRQQVCRVCAQCWENDRLWQRLITPLTTIIIANIVVSRASSEAIVPAQQKKPAERQALAPTRDQMRWWMGKYRQEHPYCGQLDDSWREVEGLGRLEPVEVGPDLGSDAGVRQEKEKGKEMDPMLKWLVDSPELKISSKHLW